MSLVPRQPGLLLPQVGLQAGRARTGGTEGNRCISFSAAWHGEARLCRRTDSRS
jgi:hypothetical protein